MSGEPLVSVILPFLNGGPAFEAALGSILRQTYRNWELLLCDDGSTDGSLALASGIRDPRVVVWSDGRTRGLAARLNECIARAKGLYIARMDADDISYPQRLERQVAHLRANPEVDVVGCRMLIFGEDGEPLGKRPAPLEHAGIVANPALGFGLAHPTWMARASWYRRHLYDAAALRYEDAELLYRAYKTSRFANLPDLLYGYRELRGGLRKRFKTRLGRIRYLAERRARFGVGTMMQAAIAEACKAAADAALAATASRYAMLRCREEKLRAVELAEWREVMESASGPANPPLRVMVLTTIPQTLAAFFEKQLRHLADEGFEVHAVSSPGDALDNLNAGPAVTRHAVFMERTPSPLQDLRSLWNLIALMRRVRPHAVHSHTPKAGLLGMLAARLTGVPVRLYTVHGLPLETRAGFKRKILEWAERGSAACSTRAYAVSPSVRDRVVQFRLCPADKVAILGDGSCAGVDLQRFNGASAKGPSPVVSFVGRLSRDKGIEVLAEAWPTISRRVPELCLLIAGEPDATDPVSPGAMRTLRNHPRIRMLGPVPAERIPSIYAASDLIVLPTFREGLSQVALEAGAMGVPIVSTRVCGLDSVLDGVTGILVPPRDAAALCEAICELATDADLRERLGAAAKARIGEHYSDARVNQLWIAEYRRLVRESFPAAAEAMRVEG